MKKQIVLATILTGSLLVVIGQQAQAQRYQVRRAIEKNYEKKNEEEHGESGKDKGNKWLDNLNDVKLKPEYKLTESLTYATVKYKRGKPQDNKADTVIIFSNAAQKLIATRSESKKGASYAVFDLGAFASLNFNTGTKELMAFNAKAMLSKKTQDNLAHSKSDARVKANGKTKTILGYNCKGYERTEEDGTKTDEMYVADIKEFKEAGIINGNLGLGLGNVMESTHYKKGEIEQVMTAIDMKKKLDISLKPADYTRQGMLQID